MKSLAAVCILFATVSFAHAQNKARPKPPSTATVPVETTPTPEYVEITKEDFADLPKLISTHLLAFGVHLGMSRHDALMALQGFADQVTARSSTADDRIEVFAGTEKENVAMSLYFDQGMVSKIGLFPPMMKFLHGRSRELLTTAAFTLDSPLRLELLGREDRATRSADASLEKSTGTFVYDKEGFQLERNEYYFSATHQSYTNMGIFLVTPAKVR